TYRGPAIDDMSVAESIPQDIFAVLLDVNGFIAFDGAFHFRGICAEPSWHSLQQAWFGVSAVHRLFASIRSSDVPFAEDALGDQFVLRDDQVYRLQSETGVLLALEADMQDFLQMLVATPLELLPTDVI